MRIVAEGTVVRGRKGTEGSSAAFPGVCVLPGSGGRSDRWLCGFRSAPTKAAAAGQRALLSWSDDGGATWREPFEPFRSPALEGRQGTFRGAYYTPLGGPDVLATICWVDTSDPTRPFFNEQTEGLLPTKIFHALSSDRGASWSAPTRMDTYPIAMETPITGPTLLLANGDWACQFELNKAYEDVAVWRHASVLMISNDRGKSWPLVSVAANDPANRVFYWDQRPGVLPDGSVLDLFWTYDNAAAAYLPVHARRSTDHGRTWSALWDTGVPGQPAPPVGLPDGRIAMVYVDRTSAPTIKIRASADGGRTWPAGTESVLYGGGGSSTVRKSAMKDAWSEMGKFSVGLPSTARLPGGDIIAVYYAGQETDVTDIRWGRVQAD